MLLIGLVRLVSGPFNYITPTTDTVLLGITLSLLYIIMVRLAGPMSRGLWMGYVYFILLVLLLMLGLTASLLLLTVGTAIAVALYYVRHRAVQHDTIAPLNEYLARLGVCGGALILGYVVLTGWGRRARLSTLAIWGIFCAC